MTDTYNKVFNHLYFDQPEEMTTTITKSVVNPDYDAEKRMDYNHDRLLEENRVIELIKTTAENENKNYEMHLSKIIVTFAIIMFYILFTISIVVIALYMMNVALTATTIGLAVLCVVMVMVLLDTIWKKGFENMDIDKKMLASFYILTNIFYIVIVIIIIKATYLSVWSIISNLEPVLQIMILVSTILYFVIFILKILYIIYTKKINF